MRDGRARGVQTKAAGLPRRRGVAQVMGVLRGVLRSVRTKWCWSVCILGLCLTSWLGLLCDTINPEMEHLAKSLCHAIKTALFPLFYNKL